MFKQNYDFTSFTISDMITVFMYDFYHRSSISDELSDVFNIISNSIFNDLNKKIRLISYALDGGQDTGVCLDYSSVNHGLISLSFGINDDGTLESDYFIELLNPIYKNAPELSFIDTIDDETITCSFSLTWNSYDLEHSGLLSPDASNYDYYKEAKLNSGNCINTDAIDSLQNAHTQLVNIKYYPTIISAINSIDDEYKRLYWNANQEETEGFAVNSITTPVFITKPYYNGTITHYEPKLKERIEKPNFSYKGLKVYCDKTLDNNTLITTINPITTKFLSDMINDCKIALRNLFDHKEEQNG